MRWVVCFAAILAFAGQGLCADQQKLPTLLPCPSGVDEAHCNPPRHDLKEAKAAFNRGLKLQQSAPDQAYKEFDHASQLVPRNVEYVTSRELARQQLVSSHLQRGNSELESGKQIEALAEFRSALSLDPSNQFAQQRLQDAVGDSVVKPSAPPGVVDESPEIHLAPNLNRASFHFRGDSRELLTTIASAYGVSAQVEDSVPSRRVFFDIDDVDFYK